VARPVGKGATTSRQVVQQCGRLVDPLGVHTLTRGAGKNAESWPEHGCGRTVLPVMSRQVRKVLAWSGLLAAAVVVAAAAVYVIFWPVSDLIAKHDVGAITGRGYGAALQKAGTRPEAAWWPSARACSPQAP